MKCWTFNFKVIIRAVFALSFTALLLAALYFANPSGSFLAAAAIRKAEIDTVIEEVCDGGVYTGRRFNEKYDYMLDSIKPNSKERITGESLYHEDGIEITMGGYTSLELKNELKKDYRYIVININGIINPDGVFITLCDYKGNNLGTKSLSQLKGPDEKPIPYSITEPTGFVIDPVASGFTSFADFSSVVIDAIEGASVILKEIFLTDMEGDYSFREEKIINPQSVVLEEGQHFDLRYNDKKAVVFRISSTAITPAKGDIILDSGVIYKIFTQEKASQAAAYYNRYQESILSVFYCDYLSEALIKPDYNSESFLKGETNNNEAIKFNADIAVSETEDSNELNYRYLKIKTEKNASDIKVNFCISEDLMEIETDDYSISNASYGYKILKNISQDKGVILIDLLKCNIDPFTALTVKGAGAADVSLISTNHTQKTGADEIENTFFKEIIPEILETTPETTPEIISARADESYSN